MRDARQNDARLEQQEPLGVAVLISEVQEKIRQTRQWLGLLW
jgi:hypothetical protein